MTVTRIMIQMVTRNLESPSRIRNSLLPRGSGLKWLGPAHQEFGVQRLEVFFEAPTDVRVSKNGQRLNLEILKNGFIHGTRKLLLRDESKQQEPHALPFVRILSGFAHNRQYIY